MIAEGDAAVTQFSGATKPVDVPKNAHPLDVTLIDLTKPTLQVFDLSKLGGPPAGQLANAPSKFQAKAGDIGQVFGVTLDGGTEKVPPNIYVGATSLFGLQIAEDDGKGGQTRLATGSPAAVWMPGQFAVDKGGSPGAIWKIDGATGAISLFSTIVSGNAENAGPGLGGLAYDPMSQSLYAANLETGMIHRLDMSGRELETFDHGLTARTGSGLDPIADDPKRRMSILSPKFSVEDPNTWGYADNRRMPVALAIESDRLYYSVAEGPAIWSVGLGTQGQFLNDARLELQVTGTPNNNLVTAIAFDGPEKMFLSQRGETTGSYAYATFARPQQSVVYRYRFDAAGKTWNSAPDETAISLEQPHRATNGGLALGYGYDKTGAIDFGACRQTLWTSGEHLREGASGPGEKTVHGLQGNRKDLGEAASLAAAASGSAALNAGGKPIAAESDLKQPLETWFTDNDQSFADTSIHGPIGAIAIYQKCEGSSQKRPVYTAPAKLPPGIYIAKTCFALSGAPGKFKCTVSVRNTGIENFNPVSFSDFAVVKSPGSLDEITPIEDISPDKPDWICNSPPAASVNCVLPAGALPPNTKRKVTFVADSKLGNSPDDDGKAFRNCAELNAPHRGKACWSTDDGDPLSENGILISKGGPAKCDPGTDCTFTLKLTNSDSTPFDGDIFLSDQFIAQSTPTNVPITSTDLNCIGGNPTQLPFECVVPVTLAPGAAKKFNVTVQMPAAPADFWAENCFAAFDPFNIPPGAVTTPVTPAPPNGAFGSPTTPACHWVQAGNPPPESNLFTKKKAQNGGQCFKDGAGLVACEYSLAVINEGPSPVTAPISIKETLPAGIASFTIGPEFNCAGGPTELNCTTPAPVTLAPGDALVSMATVRISVANMEPLGCSLPNSFGVTSPVGAPSDTFADDNFSGAVADAALIPFVDPITGVVLVTCDPTNLQTTKVKQGDCAEAGDGYSCKYKVTITNTGPDPYEGPINLTESAAGATSVSATGSGWNCSGSGSTQQCLMPPFKLPKGQSVSLDVDVKMPKQDSVCAASNTATMTFPLANTRFNQRADDDSATASSRIPAPGCDKKPECTAPGPGEMSSRSGACVCAEGYTRDRKGQCVQDLVRNDPPPAAPTADTCPDGNPIPRSGACPCDGGQIWDREKKVCAGTCEPGPNEYRTSAGQCVCKTGYDRGEAGLCIAEQDVPPVKVPPRDDDYDRCDPGPNEVLTSSGRCICAQGYERYRGACVAERDEPKCQPGPNEFRTSKGNCICKEGYERDNDGRCVAEQIECPRGLIYSNRARRCVEPTPAACPRGYERDDGGRCVPHEGEVMPACSSREYLNSNNRCVCKEGYVSVDGDCVVPKREPQGCGTGFYSEDGKCRRMECPQGTEGNYPNCKAVKVPCPNGQGYQPFCRTVEKPQPKPCPKGYRGVEPNCVIDVPDVPAKKPAQKSCPNGYQGTPPNCRLVVDKPAKPIQVPDVQTTKPAKPNAGKPVQPQLNKDQINKIFNDTKATTPKPDVAKPAKPNKQPKPAPAKGKPACAKGQVFFKGKCVSPS